MESIVSIAKKKSYTIITIDTEKVFDKNLNHVKILNKLGIEESYLNLIKHTEKKKLYR